VNNHWWDVIPLVPWYRLSLLLDQLRAVGVRVDDFITDENYPFDLLGLLRGNDRFSGFSGAGILRTPLLPSKGVTLAVPPDPGRTLPSPGGSTCTAQSPLLALSQM